MRDLTLKYGSENIKINISPDRTKKQQDKYKELRDELTERKKTNPNLIIKNYEIIENNRTVYHSPQSFWNETSIDVNDINNTKQNITDTEKDTSTFTSKNEQAFLEMP